MLAATEALGYQSYTHTAASRGRGGGGEMVSPDSVLPLRFSRRRLTHRPMASGKKPEES